jgi:large subunit ribosomal protein L17
MRHGTSGRKLGRTSSHRLAMFRNMVTSLLEHERIYTTDARAKELRRWADWMITLGKRGDLHARRQALRVIRDKSVVHKLFTDLAQRYQARNGGYTRTVKVGFRVGDGAPLSLIELLTGETEKKKKKKKTKAVKAAKVKPPAAEPAPGTEPEVPEASEAESEESAAEEVFKEKKKAKGKPPAKKPKTTKAAAKKKVEGEPETSEAQPEAAAEEATEPAKKERAKKADE